jgi:hypothetical protein
MSQARPDLVISVFETWWALLAPRHSASRAWMSILATHAMMAGNRRSEAQHVRRRQCEIGNA